MLSLISRRVDFLFVWALCAALCSLPASAQEGTKAPAEAKWGKEMAAFAAEDQAHPPREGGILFVGSSSIRLWDLKKFFPDLPVTNRGFGGSQVADSVTHFDLLVTPHKPRIIVFYAGDNDLAVKKSPAEVAQNFEQFVAKVRKTLPKTHVIYIPIKPSGSRWELIDKQREQNKLVREKFAADKLFSYLPIEPLLLSADKIPDDALFMKDRLHLNNLGYEKWTAELRPLLDKILAEKE